MSNPLRVVVIDDEPLARESITSLLSKDVEVELCGRCGDGISALSTLEREHPDVIFLDIQMPGRDGFDLLEALSATSTTDELPVIVLVTAYDRYALRAFEYHAVDYLLKPYTDERFYTALHHAKRRARERINTDLRHKLASLLSELAPESAAPPSAERFPIRIDSATTLVDYHEITWFEAADHYVIVHEKNKEHICRESLNNIEGQLPSHRFRRIHRNAIVNIDAILQLCNEGKKEHYVVLKNGRQLKVSRRRLTSLKKHLGLD